MSKRLQDKIEKLEAKYRVLADNLLDAIWVLDAQTLRYEYMTPSIERISGYTPEEMMELTIQDRLTPESFAKVMAVLREEKARFDQGARTSRVLEVESVNKNGEKCWLEIKAKFVKEADESLKIVGVTRQINERKIAEQKRDDLIRKLAEALAEKEKLIKELKLLRSLLPICSGCKRIRDENDQWWPLDLYVERQTQSRITHTICPDCRSVLYPGL
ncbi:MAG: PAS domain S-box protein [Syntrophobacteraceae bacterium]|nr:PAS domain S-box protein [Syntrophobacteraceae bacterium]